MKDRISKRDMTERVRVVIALFCGGRKPPLRIMDDVDALQEWVGLNQRELSGWVGMAPMNVSVIEAAETLAESQVSNGYEEVKP